MINLYIYINSNLSYAIPGQFGFQFPATTLAFGIINLHHHIMFLLVLILFFVFYLIDKIVKMHFITFRKNNYNNNDCDSTYILNFKKFVKINTLYNITLRHNALIEIIWIIIPTLILLLIVFPSFSLLYAYEVFNDSFVSIKIIGHQWYWTYEYTVTGERGVYHSHYDETSDIADFPLTFLYAYIWTIDEITRVVDWEDWDIDMLEYVANDPNDIINTVGNTIYNFSFDSYMKYENELSTGELRLLAVTNPLVLPVKTNIKLYVTSDDVLHSWAIPAFGCKMDACPGRLNEISLFIKKLGNYYGQCSELCGVNHGFMPIEVMVVSEKEFIVFTTLHFYDVELKTWNFGEENLIFFQQMKFFIRMREIPEYEPKIAKNLLNSKLFVMKIDCQFYKHMFLNRVQRVYYQK